MSAHQARVIDLQRQLTVARNALTKIKHGCSLPDAVAEQALDDMEPLDRPRPLQGLVGHARRPRR